MIKTAVSKKTDTDLKKLCRKWKKVLRLRDWDISIRFARHYEMGDNRGGECSTIINKKTAAIVILDPNDWHAGIMRRQDIEKTIVHELCHIHLATHGDGLPLIVEEQAVECLASGFVSLKRFWDD